MQKYDVVVAGGGLSGLVFAHYAAKQGKKILILEKDDTLGGCISTVEIFPGYYAEKGSHTIYNSYATILDIISTLSLQNRIIPHQKKPYLLWKDRNIKGIMSELNILGILRVPFALLSGLKKKGLSTHSYYCKLMGKKNAENFIVPVMSAVICQDSKDVAADLLLKSRAKNKIFPRSFTFQKGMAEFIDNICHNELIDVKTLSAAINVKRENNSYLIKTVNGEEYKSDHIVCAVDAGSAAELLKDIEPELSKHLKKIKLSKTKALLAAFNKENASFKEFAYIIGINKDFRSVVSGDVTYIKEKSSETNNEKKYSPRKYRSFTFHFKPDKLAELNSEIIEKFQINTSDEIKISVKNYLLPSLEVKHNEWLEKLENISNGINGLTLLGNYFNGLSMEDCALRARQQAEKLL